jgi:glutathione S-transferase
MIQLHFAPSSAAMVPHILLEEIGVPYERVLVDKQNGGHKTPAYLALNPNGLIPVLYETAAICLHLSDTHPKAALMPPMDTRDRAHAYKWLMWLTNTLQATLIVYFYPERWADTGHTEVAAEVQRNAQARVGPLLNQLDAEIERRGGPWFMGEQFTLLDAYVFALCRWTRNFPRAPARDRQHLGPYLQRMLARPSVQRVLANEGLVAPYV